MRVTEKSTELEVLAEKSVLEYNLYRLELRTTCIKDWQNVRITWQVTLDWANKPLVSKVLLMAEHGYSPVVRLGRLLDYWHGELRRYVNMIYNQHSGCVRELLGFYGLYDLTDIEPSEETFRRLSWVGEAAQLLKIVAKFFELSAIPESEFQRQFWSEETTVIER